MQGFIVFRDGSPAKMELHDDIQGGLDIQFPIPIFSTRIDAKKAALSDAATRPDRHEYDVRHVSVQIGNPIPVHTDPEDAE
jgi:hypothetical protein